MSDDSQPIQADELLGLFGACAGRLAAPCALAVSGGSDSTTLMVLFADWLRQVGSNADAHVVLTVDHGLRAGSDAEARAVAERAAALGFRPIVLSWLGPKPQTGVQAAARAARYRLMRGYMDAHGTPTLLTAHTRDDQAETLLMRLARGSGLDGLSAMAPVTEAGAVRIVRPLLGVAKARLQATLAARRMPWIEDPSNRSAVFERTRWRAARAPLEALGLSDAMLATSARRLHRARAALEAATDACFAEVGGLVCADPCGLFRIEREGLRRVPEEIALRLLGRCIAVAGGTGEPVAMAALEGIVAGVLGGGAGSWTLSRAHITGGPEVVQVEREPGRLPLPVMALAGGARELWDGRFAVEIADGFSGCLEVRALGAGGLAELKRLGRGAKGTSALAMVPSFWRDNALLAVPAIGFWAHEELKGVVSAVFTGLRYNSAASGAGSSDDFDAI